MNFVTHDTAVLGDTSLLNTTAQQNTVNDTTGQPSAFVPGHAAHEHGSEHAVPAPASATEGSGDAFAITSFVLGIVSIISGYFFIIPVLGLVFGILAKRRGATMSSLAGWGIGINTVILAFWVVLAGIFGTLATFAIMGSLFWA